MSTQTLTNYNHAYLLPGRQWEVGSNGTEDADGNPNVVAGNYTETYIAATASPLDEDELFTTITGLPAIGSAHPSFPNLYAQTYRVKEREGSEKNVYEIEVSFQPVSSTGTPEEGEDPEDPAIYVEQIGWRSGSVQRDLVADAATGVAVLNTAGQPFESVPQVDRPSPTWFKVFKTKSRQASMLDYVNRVNQSSMSFGGGSFAADRVRCVQVDEERIFDDASGYNYRYSIALQVISNKVKINGGDTETECGWQIPIVSTGTMARPSAGATTLERITVATDDGSSVAVSSPVLLDANGCFSESQTTPYTMLFVAYVRDTFPAIFTSEPPITPST